MCHARQVNTIFDRIVKDQGLQGAAFPFFFNAITFSPPNSNLISSGKQKKQKSHRYRETWGGGLGNVTLSHPERLPEQTAMPHKDKETGSGRDSHLCLN